jgi:hypothetical protein
MKSWHSARVVQKITSIGYLCLLLVNQEKKLKCVFGCIFEFYMAILLLNSIANNMHWYHLHNYQTLPQVLKGGGI